MDEPLSALDQPRRDEILPYLSRLRSLLGLPIVYASHALDEVMRLADTLVLLDAGRVAAAGPLAEIATDVNLPLAARDGAGGILRGHIAAHEPRPPPSVRSPAARTCSACRSSPPPPGTPIRLLVPAREVILALDPPQAISVNNILPAHHHRAWHPTSPATPP